MMRSLSSIRLLRAFALVELMVVLVVTAIVLGVALPEFRQALQRYRLGAAVSDFFGALELARSQAIARGERVLLAPHGGADWRDGWAVFVDRDGDSQPGPGDELIATHPALVEGLTIHAVFTGGQVPGYVAYNSAGRSCSAASSLVARWGTVSLTQNGEVRRIKVNMLGRSRICDPARDGASCAGPA